MRIAILAYNLRVAGGLVVGRNLVAQIPVLRPNHQYLIIVPKGLGYETHKDRGYVKCLEVTPMRFFKRIYFDLIKLQCIVRNFKPDIILGLGNLGLVAPPCVQAILFHKPQLLYSSRHYALEPINERIRDWILERTVKRCLAGTQLVFCQTPVTKSRFAKKFGYPLEQITILPNAVSEFVKNNVSKTEVPDVLRNSRYFDMFLLSKFYAHKNFEVLLDLYSNYGEELKDTRCIITIAPNQHTNAVKFLKEVHRRKLEDKIVNVGPLKEDELSGYFCNCGALLFPTLLESFSGTYLEAMHFGLPILTSDLDFAHYICGEAALYFSPWEPADITEKITLLKNNSFMRQDLADKGKKRLATFFRSWDSIAMDAMNAIERVAGEYRKKNFNKTPSA